MISLLQGLIKKIGDQSVVIQSGPLGFDLFVPNAAAFVVDKPVELFVYLHWNQENGPSLYGFQDELDKEVFKLIISCSGIGPKIGLAVINQLGAGQFLQAVQTNNEEMLSKVSGIGRKKAEQMIVHLRHKIKKYLDSGVAVDTESGQIHQQWNDVSNALESLNYSRQEINKVMRYLTEIPSDKPLSFELLMRKALAFLAKKG